MVKGSAPLKIPYWMWLESKNIKAKRILDVGCGRDPACNHVEMQFDEYITLDITRHPQVKIVGSVYNLPFKEESFDVVLLLEVLEHLLYPFDALKEVSRVVREGGKVYITTPYLIWRHSYYTFTDMFYRDVFPIYGLHVVELGYRLPDRGHEDIIRFFLKESNVSRETLEDKRNVPLGYMVECIKKTQINDQEHKKWR